MKIAALTLIAIVFLLMSPIHADLKITTEITMSSFGLEIYRQTMNEYQKAKMTRVDNNDAMNPLMKQIHEGTPESYNITRYDKELQWVIYDFDSSYGVIQMYDSDDNADSLSGEKSDTSSAVKDSVVWKYEKYSLPDTIISNIHCRGIRLKAISEKSGSEIKIDLWTTQDCEWCQEYIEHESNSELRDDTNPFRSAQLLFMFLNKTGADTERLKDLANDVKGITILWALKMSASLESLSLQDEPAPDTAIISPLSLNDSADSNKDMFDFDMGEQPIDSVEQAAFEQLREMLSTNQKSGLNEIIAIKSEIVHVDHSVLPDSLFEVPVGYKEF